MTRVAPAAAKKVAVVTGSRADYGLLRPTIGALATDPRFELQLVVAAMHLNSAFGLTVREIVEDSFPIAARVETIDVIEPVDLGRAFSEAIAGFTETLNALQPDLLIVLGDRHEMLSAALAATGLGVSIAHIHGGELSEGSVDDALRHCLTKLSQIHFVATRAYGERVCQMGEQPDRVHVVGAPAIEAIQSLPLLDRDALAEALGGVSLERPLVALTLHPTSLHPNTATVEASEVVRGIDDVLDQRGTIVVTLPNDDLGNAQTRKVLVGYSEGRPNVHAFRALGQLRYLSLLRHADAVLGNSSSALIEAPSFQLPAVNVGDRQRGRLRAPNVIDSTADAAAIAAALRQALDSDFRRSLAGIESPYGSGDTSSRILDVLDSARPDELRTKRFFDLPDGAWRSSLDLANGSR